MDLLHSGRFDGFCLVSSDSDFTRLATRIREHGLGVYGFGEAKTPESFRQACRRFIYTENLLPEAPAADRAPDPKAKPMHPPSKAIPLLRKAAAALEDDGEGWVALSGVGSQLNKLYPDFDPRTYGHAKLSDLVEKTGAFDTERMKGGGIRIRPKQSANNGAKKKK